jgi:hypothetical protein
MHVRQLARHIAAATRRKRCLQRLIRQGLEQLERDAMIYLPGFD